MVKPGTIFTGDNLPIMRGMDSESIALVYLDPPFNSNRNYAAPIGSKAAGAEFKDVWTLSDTDDAWWGELADIHPALYRVIDGIGAAGGAGNKAYCIYMAVRLLEMHRLLKPTGSLYLHCDSTMSHSLKLMLDAIFGKDNFRNEVIWKRTHAHNDPGRYGRNADVILFYSKSEKFNFTQIFAPYTREYVEKHFRGEDQRGRFRLVVLTGPGVSSGDSNVAWRGYRPSQSGRHWSVPKRIVNSLVGEEQAKTMSILQRLELLDANDYIVFSRNGIPSFKQYLSDMPGTPLQAIWTDINPISANAKERIGYPTQKPLQLLQRIIASSSNENDIVLDPFCGCATACLAAESLRRKWIGIDISEKAFELINDRLKNELGGIFSKVIHRTDIPKRAGAKRSKDIKHTLFGKQKGVCNGCRSAFEFRNFEVDHIVPLAEGGADDDDNLQLLCGWCNRKKGTRPMEFLVAELDREGIRDRGYASR